MDEVLCSFQHEDFTTDRPLAGEFLLGYHCQRQALWKKTENDKIQGNDNND